MTPESLLRAENMLAAVRDKDRGHLAAVVAHDLFDNDTVEERATAIAETTIALLMLADRLAAFASQRSGLDPALIVRELRSGLSNAQFRAEDQG